MSSSVSSSFPHSLWVFQNLLNCESVFFKSSLVNFEQLISFPSSICFSFFSSSYELSSLSLCGGNNAMMAPVRVFSMCSSFFLPPSAISFSKSFSKYSAALGGAPLGISTEQTFTHTTFVQVARRF